MKAILKINFSEKNSVKKAAIKNGERIHWDYENKFWFWEGDGDVPSFLASRVVRIEDDKPAEFTKSDVMKRAWQIRREAANAMCIEVSEVHFGECLRIAWAECKADSFGLTYGAAAEYVESEREAYRPCRREVEFVDGGYQEYRY